MSKEMIKKENTCPICNRSNLDNLRNDLFKCKKNNRTKDRKIQALTRKIHIGTLVGVAIAAIFGKEALDSITEWLSSVQDFGSTSSDLFSFYPAPGVLPVFAAAFLLSGVRRRR
jgi:uncharacterized protein (TIGR03382 family)